MNSTHQNISPLAWVSPGAKIDKSAVIEPFAYIDKHVSIGANTWIGPHAVIHSHTEIGEDCKVFSGAVVGAVPQDLKFKGEPSTVQIGNRTTIRECVTINRGTEDRMVTKVGSDCLIMAYCHLAHDVVVGDHVIMANSANIAGHVTIQDWAIIEGMVGVQQFVTIGQHAFVAGGSMVRKNIPPYIKAAREPLSFIGVNSIGLRRRGFTNDQIINIEDLYRLLYVQNANLSQALRIAETEIAQSEEKETILSFIQSSDKGIIRGPF
ncbi:MAG: acyl-ACP--UDP-N-acetylglucosamine O-acyltransferase [Bacteroidetes bacterium]|nr:acyl-ACP--UDP-N-acetylglucosamine O-acyltransferase [Bacteroidota bacterium]